MNKNQTIPEHLFTQLKQLEPTPEYGWQWDDDRWLLLLRAPDKEVADPDGYVIIQPDAETAARCGVVFLLLSDQDHVWFDNDFAIPQSPRRERDLTRIKKAFDRAGAKGMTTKETANRLKISYPLCAARILELVTLCVIGPIVRPDLVQARALVNALLASDTPEIP